MLKGSSRGIQAPQGAQLRFSLPNVSEVVAACTKHVLTSLTLTVGILSRHVLQPPSLGFMLL